VEGVTVSDVSGLAATIFRRAGSHSRFVVAIAGPPGAGKSTISGRLQQMLPQGSAIVVPMDGFHYDDVILNARGMRARKGAPETFDFAGFKVLLQRIRAREPEIAIPVFDRNMELARAGAAIVTPESKFVLVEGNYLLLDEAPWRDLAPLFDFSIFIDVDRAVLERRLMQRWDEHGKTEAESREWIASNDMPNIDRVLGARRQADMVLRLS